MPYRQNEYVSEGHTVKRTRHGYIIVENSTGHKLNFFKNKKLAEFHSRELEKGIGFNGYTPGFMLDPVVVDRHP